MQKLMSDQFRLETIGRCLSSGVMIFIFFNFFLFLKVLLHKVPHLPYGN